MNQKLPDRIFGIDTEEAYKVFLEEAKKEKPETSRNESVSMSMGGTNLEDYVFLEKNGIYVAKKRSHLESNWNQAHEKLHGEGARMLTLREFVDFLDSLRSGNVKDGLGTSLSRSDLNVLYSDITEKINPYRAEWLDTDFKVINGELYINYNHRIVNGRLQPRNSEPLENCLMESGYVDLFSANRQGMPTRTSDNQDFYYGKPLNDNNSVAWFYADSGRAYLYCDRDPGYSYSRLGVRAVREKPT